MARVLITIGLVALVFWVFSIVDCAVQPAQRHRGVSKGTWILLVVLLPVIGGIMWFTIGRSRPKLAAAAPRRAPDDDPAFMGRIGNIRDQDERIRRLEEELAQLDAEDDDPRWNQPPASAAGPGDDVGDDDGVGAADDDDPPYRPRS